LCPTERIHGRTRGCKWSLLKVRDGKYKREHAGTQVESGGRESVKIRNGERRPSEKETFFSGKILNLLPEK
jgi:hypothetical protein